MSNLYQCSKCKVDKDISSFSWRDKKLGTRNYYCKICQANYAKGHYHRNSDEYKARASVYKADMYLWFAQTKQTISDLVGGCAICQEGDIVCLDFHHVDPSVKSFHISERSSKTSKKRIISEIEKCVLLCSNCHRKLHAGRIISTDFRPIGSLELTMGSSSIG